MLRGEPVTDGERAASRFLRNAGYQVTVALDGADDVPAPVEVQDHPAGVGTENAATSALYVAALTGY